MMMKIAETLSISSLEVAFARNALAFARNAFASPVKTL